MLYKRALCRRSRLPKWSPQEACRVVGDAYQKLQRNVQQGRFTEKVDSESKSFLFEIGSTKVVTAGNSNQIHLQNRWRLNKRPTSFNIAHRSYRIEQLEINEPYLIVVASRKYYPFPSNLSVIVFDLEKEKRIHKLTIPVTMDNMCLVSVIVKCNDEILITFCAFEYDGDFFGEEDSYASLLTARQMPCNAHPETDFPVIDELNIPDLNFAVMFLEDQRVLLVKRWTTTAYILSMKPLRIIRQYQFIIKYSCETKYWNGWLFQSNRDSNLIDTASKSE